ncbi:MAG: cytochrome P460 family protein [Rhodoplanes sp.]
MVKDSRKYTSTGGWGFAHFEDGKAPDEAVHNTCFFLPRGLQSPRLCLQPLRTLKAERGEP